MPEWKPLHEEAESLLRAAVEVRPDVLRAELATCDDELAALRSEMLALDGSARHRLSFMVTTGAMLFVAAVGTGVWLLGGGP
jgi:hypothetical protein